MDGALAAARLVEDFSLGGEGERLVRSRTHRTEEPGEECYTGDDKVEGHHFDSLSNSRRC